MCRDDRRREEVRKKNLNGLDYVEVEEVDETKKPLLQVYLLGKLKPKDLVTTANVRIDGGVRVKDIVVTGVELQEGLGSERDDVLKISVNKPGDFSTYTLHVVEPDMYDRPGTEPLAGFDPQYAKVDFTFYGAAPISPTCPPTQEATTSREEPEINYLAKDYASFRQLIFDRLATISPTWQERHVPDFGVTLVELFAYLGDQLSYYQDAVATEAYLETARQRISVRRHLRLIDYSLHEGCNARAWVCIETDRDLELPCRPPGEPKPAYYFISDTNQTLTERAGVLREEDLRDVFSSQYEVFEPVEDRPIQLFKSRNRIRFYTWDNRECQLPAGATSATLWDSSCADKDRLRAGDVLIFEEVKGPRTGREADAGLKRRHAVRLTKVTQGSDTLHTPPVPILHIEWDREDALPFPLVISAIGQAPECKYIDDITIARGNVVLVDHGRTVTEELGTVPVAPDQPAACEGEGQPADRIQEAAPFHPVLTQRPVTHRVPFPENKKIARRQAQVFDQLFQDIRLKVVESFRITKEPQRSNGTDRLVLSNQEFETLTQIFGDKAISALKASPGVGQEGKQRREGEEDVSRRGLQKLFLREGQLLMRPTSRNVVPRRGSQFADKIQRLITLRERAHSGYRLTDREAQEVGAMFGDELKEYGEKLKQTNPLLYGSAQQAMQQDTAEALPFLTLTEEVDGKEWLPRRDLLNSGREDRHVVVEVDDAGGAHLRFGDGHCGRRLRADATLRATYRVGNGERGNVVAGAISHLIRRDQSDPSVDFSGIRRVCNPQQAEGGTDPEPMARATLSAPASLRSGIERAVVDKDYARLAKQHPNVQSAAAELRWAHGWYEVRVYIDPLHGVDLDEGLREDLTRNLHAYRRIGHHVVVLPACYVPLDIALTVAVSPGQLREHVSAELRDVLGKDLLSGGRKGFFHPDNLTFGEPIYLSRLVAAAQAVPGVLSVEVTRLCRLFHQPDNEIEEGKLPIGPFEVARLDNDTSRPEWGKLTLTITGGR